MSVDELCPPCRAGEHAYCVRRSDVDNPPGEWQCECSCDPGAPDVETSALARVEVTWPERASAIARSFDDSAGELALAAPTTRSERAEIGDAIARYMLAAPDGRSAMQVVRTIVDRLGAAEAMNVAEVLGNWALEIAAAADKKRGDK